MASSSPRAQTRSRPSSTRSSVERAQTTPQPSGFEQTGHEQIQRRSSQRAPHPLVRLAGRWLASCAGMWLGIAHLLGGVARRVGTSARDIDPEHRRDGVGLLLIAAAVVVAADRMVVAPRPAGGSVHAFVAGGTGSLAWTVPLLLVALAGWVLRHPAGHAPTGRLVIGWAAARGWHSWSSPMRSPAHRSRPRAPRPCAAVADSSDSCSRRLWCPAVSVWVAVPLLILLALFGLLVLTATPVHQIPERISGLWDRLSAANGKSLKDRPGRGRQT